MFSYQCHRQSIGFAEFLMAVHVPSLKLAGTTRSHHLYGSLPWSSIPLLIRFSLRMIPAGINWRTSWRSRGSVGDQDNTIRRVSSKITKVVEWKGCVSQTLLEQFQPFSQWLSKNGPASRIRELNGLYLTLHHAFWGATKVHGQIRADRYVAAVGGRVFPSMPGSLVNGPAICS